MACWSCVRYSLTFYSLGESFVFEKGVETFPGVGANPMAIMVSDESSIFEYEREI